MSGELVIAPRVHAETDKHVLEGFVRVDNRRQLLGLAPHQRSLGVEIPIHVMLMTVILDQGLRWRINLQASSAVQICFMRTINTTEARLPLPSQSPPVSRTLRPTETNPRGRA